MHQKAKAKWDSTENSSRFTGRNCFHLRRIKSPGQRPAASPGVKFRDSSKPRRMRGPPCPPLLRSCQSPWEGSGRGTPRGCPLVAGWLGSTFEESYSYLPVPASAPRVQNTEPGDRMLCQDWRLPPSPVLGQGQARLAGARIHRVLQN